MKLSERKLIASAILVIVFYYLPYFYFGERSHILIHDNLDSNIAWVKILLNNHAAFKSPDTTIDAVMGGVPMASIYATYDIPLLMFSLLGIFWGYVVNKIMVTLIGFWGMFLLLKKHILTEEQPLIAVGVSLLFALLPYWSFTASVSGIPLLLFAFLNLRAGDSRCYNWVIIVIFAFHSNLVLSGAFIGLVLVCIAVYDIIKRRKLPIMFTLGLVLLGVSYGISHYPLFYSFLFQKVVSHRTEFDNYSIDLRIAFNRLVDVFIDGQYHAYSLHALLLIPILAFFVFNYKAVPRTAKLLLLFIILTSLFYGFMDHPAIKPISDFISTIFPIQMQRFHFLHPAFWYILFALALAWLMRFERFGRFIVYGLLLIQMAYIAKYHEMIANRTKPTFQEFYSVATFDKIKEEIGKPLNSFKVVSIGLHPAVAQFNGFYTIDGYFPSYPLSHKQKFEKVIEKELKKDPLLLSYFDRRGSRCYAFSSEIGADFLHKRKNAIDSLNYRYDLLYNMGAKYIISSCPINTNINMSLDLLLSSKKTNTSQQLFLYAINP